MRNTYKPRRATKRWLDGDCPAGVLAIYDNGGKTADRYTVLYTEVYGHEPGREYETGWIGGRGMSEAPTHPQGVGISFELRCHEAASLRYRWSHQAAKWSSLPDAVKACVRRDLEGDQ